MCIARFSSTRKKVSTIISATAPARLMDVITRNETIQKHYLMLYLKSTEHSATRPVIWWIWTLYRISTNRKYVLSACERASRVPLAAFRSTVPDSGLRVNCRRTLAAPSPLPDVRWASNAAAALIPIC